jgi:hypothetical protein
MKGNVGIIISTITYYQSLALATANFKNMLAAITEYVRKLVQI